MPAFVLDHDAGAVVIEAPSDITHLMPDHENRFSLQASLCELRSTCLQPGLLGALAEGHQLGFGKTAALFSTRSSVASECFSMAFSTRAIAECQKLRDFKGCAIFLRSGYFIRTDATIPEVAKYRYADWIGADFTRSIAIA